MRAFFWTVLGLLLAAAITGLVWFLVVEHNNGERSKNERCVAEGGNGRVYVKYGRGGTDADAGTYCVRILYKE